MEAGPSVEVIELKHNEFQRPILEVDQIKELVAEKGFWEALEIYFPDWRTFWRKEWIDALYEIDNPDFLLIRLRGQVEASHLDSEEFMRKYVSDMRDIRSRQILRKDVSLQEIISLTNTIHDINVKIEKLNAYRRTLIDQLQSLIEKTYPVPIEMN